MKKYIVPVILVVAFGLYVVLSSRNSTTLTTPAPVTENNTTTPPTPTPQPVPAPAPRPSGPRDGTYIGPVADAFYGPMQVSVVVSGGKITAVNVLQSPGDQGESRLINNRSNPILVREAIAAQSANVDVVSGATQSSEAFMESLKAALAKANG